MPSSPPAAPLGFALLLLAAAGSSLPVRRSSDGSLSGVMQKWKEYQLQCLKYLYEAPPIAAEGKFCNRTFDNYACWPDGLPGTYVNVSCPWYLPWASAGAVSLESALLQISTADVTQQLAYQSGKPKMIRQTFYLLSSMWMRKMAPVVLVICLLLLTGMDSLLLHGQVYRFCTPEGTWLLKENSTLPWRNLSECEASDQDAPEEQLLNLSVIYTIGYALSFSALVIATAILLGFRHLHCTRNYIHLNLFTSFILRAISVFIKDSVVKWMYSTATQEHQWEGLISFQESLSCRLVFVMMQYCVAANYYWLLVEGMYLYTLLVLSVFSEQRIFRLYLCIGWGFCPPECLHILLGMMFALLYFFRGTAGLRTNKKLEQIISAGNPKENCNDVQTALNQGVQDTNAVFVVAELDIDFKQLCVPMVFVILWGTVKYLYEDEGCWTRNYNMNYWLIIRLPILIAIGVNFLIFIRVICIIISKLQANLMCKTDIKCRLAKSTLTLIPLLGTHEVIFAFITDEHARGMLRFVKLFTELSFASFQGLMVAILYCFINNEVQMEFRKSWERWRLEHLYVQRDSSMKPLKCPANSISSGGTVGSSVYAATCQATFS